MTGIKILDRDTRAPHRRLRLWECFGKAKINPTDIKDAHSAYYAIIQQSKIEELLKTETKEIFKKEKFEILAPLEYNSLKSIIIRHIDKVINEYEKEEIVESIEEKNEWAEIENIHKITESGRLLKVTFKSTSMVTKALEDGIVVLHQYIPAKNIEREIYVRITPCYNCYSYSHKTRDCEEEAQSICANCAEHGHKQYQCQSSQSCCINCGGPHRTLASSCQVRKQIIKQKSKEMRERTRSRSRQRANQTTQNQQPQTATYASMTRTNIENVEINQREMKEMIGKIVVSIVFAQCTEAIEQGTFQKNIDQMFSLNGIPQVKFPKIQVSQNIKQLYDEMLNAKINETGADKTRPETDKRTNEKDIPDAGIHIPTNTPETQEEGAIGNQKMPTTSSAHDTETEWEKITEMDIGGQTNKRQRESMTPEQEKDKDKPTRPSKTNKKGKPQREHSNIEKQPTNTQQQQQKQQNIRPRLYSDPKPGNRWWMKIFIKKSANICIDCSTEEKRRRLRQTLATAQIKYHWKNKDITYEQLHNAVTQGTIQLKTEMFIPISEREWTTTKTTNLEDL